ncbi:unnamed protein product [Commensalibacter communis]|uniref:Uncharacterized protein n=2 Tax=Commensalibacter communis TaxID=2972786 RepID=A0A9W4X9E2_9PROT|nr:unnamed protein product [Commensalibacter communis]CAI3942770.1 unnamed protein product [Commensalibacter communis]CAI3943926.1 unnamed protein product [Commensalibacter communis]CAI3947052.1 unnamed protein product [Commensalibacter communis]
MKNLIVLVISLSFLSIFAHAKECKNMIGTFQIIPFLDSNGMNSMTQDFADVSLGKPLFKIEKQDNQAKLIDLLHSKSYIIKFQPFKNDSILDSIFKTPVTICSATINHKSNIAQVELSKVKQQQLTNGLKAIRKSWGKHPCYIAGKNANPLQTNPNIQYYTINTQS